MSVDPGQYAAARDRGSSAGTAMSLSGVRDGQHERDRAGVDVRLVEVLPLREGDRLVIHVDGSVGMSAGGAHRAADQVREILKLDELPFDVPMLVVSPGFRVEVTRPS